MLSRPLGNSAPDVMAVGFGGMPLSIKGRPDTETAIDTIHAALDAGVTLIDTADVYCLDHTDIGHNERLISAALASWGGDLDDVVVATKGGLTRPDGRWELEGRPERLRAACEASLRALDVERIDLYQLHAPDPAVPLEETAGALADLQAEGKIRWAGLSNVSVEEIERASMIVDVATVQNRLNPFFREAVDTGVLRHTAARGMGFLAYSPVGGGRLNLKLPDHPVVGRIAREHEVSPHAVVQAWVLGLAPNVIVIPGARSAVHAVDSMRAASLDLSDADREAIDAAEFSIA